MRFKYPLTAALLAIMLLFSMTACGNANQTEESESPVGVSKEDTGYDVGNVMPDFSVPLAGGGTFTLSEASGKPVFINLFATWCGPCVSEMPEINKLYGEYSDRVTFIAIDMGESEDTALNFADDNGYALPFAYSEDGEPFSFLQYIPDTFVLDADGVIVELYEGGRNYDTFKAAIDAALAR